MNTKMQVDGVGYIWPIFWINSRMDLDAIDREDLHDFQQVVFMLDNILLGWSFIFALLAVSALMFYLYNFTYNSKADSFRFEVNGQ